MYRIILIFVLVLSSFALVQAQDTSTEGETTETSSSVCDPAELNWCYAGQPWGDGRCNSDDPSETAYYYQQGYLQAAEACAAGIDNAASVSIATSTGSFSFSCRASRRADRQVDLSANWTSPADDQSYVVFSVEFELDNQDLDETFRETVNLGTFSTNASSSRTFPRNVTVTGATATLFNKDGVSVTGGVSCSVSS